MTRPFPPGALLALDIGSARTGVAACDASRILAYPVEIIPASQALDQRVVELVDDHQAAAVVVGYPLGLDGNAGLAAQKVRDQAIGLARALNVPVWLVDERLSTAEAYRKLRETGRSIKQARRLIDAQAAVGILESVLHALSHSQMVGRAVELEETDGKEQ